MLNYSTHEALGEIRSRAFYRFVQNKHVSDIWVNIILEISYSLMDPIPFHVLDRIKDSPIISKMIQTFEYKSWPKFDQTSDVKFPIDKRKLFKVLISSADYCCNLNSSQRFVLGQNIKRILDQSEPIERETLLQILINRVIHKNSKRASQLLLIDIIVHYYRKNDIKMEDFLTILKDFSENVTIQNIVLDLVFRHKCILETKYYKELLTIVVNNLHAFWMSEDTMRVCIELIMHIRSISWETDSWETDLLNSLSNIPTFHEYLIFYYRTNDKSEKILLKGLFELDYGHDKETVLKYYKKNAETKMDVIFSWLFKKTEFKIEDKELAKTIIGRVFEECIGCCLKLETTVVYKHFSHDTLDLVHLSIQEPGNVINAHVDADACILYVIKKIDEIDYDDANIWDDNFAQNLYLLIILVSWYYGTRRGNKVIQTVAAIICALAKSPKANIETNDGLNIKIKILKILSHPGFTDGREDIYDIVNGLLKELEIEFDVISEFNYDDKIDFDWID